MVDFQEPEMLISTPYADGHRDVQLAYPNNLNYNALTVFVPGRRVLREMGGHFTLKRISLDHIGSLGVYIRPYVFIRGRISEWASLEPVTTIDATDISVWADLDIALLTNYPSIGQDNILQLDLLNYVATDDMGLMIELVWYP